MAGEWVDPTVTAGSARAPQGAVARMPTDGWADPSMNEAPLPQQAQPRPAVAEEVPQGEELPFNQRKDGWAGLYNKFLRTPAQEATAIVTGAPADMTDLVDRGAYEAARFVADKLEGRDIGPYQQKRTGLPRAEDIRSTAYANTPPVKAESSGGKIIQEGLTSAIAGGPVGPLAMGLGAASGAASEAAGQATEGTSAEPWARVVGAFAPVGIGGLTTLRNRAPDIAKSTLKGVTEEQALKAQSLMDDAARAGTPLTSAEALAQITGKTNSTLLAAQRYAEQTPRQSKGLEYLREIMSGRGNANKQAFDRTVTTSGRETSEIAPAVQSAAKGEVNAARAETNRLSKPAYDATTDNPNAVLSPAASQGLNANLAVGDAIKGARGNAMKYGDLSADPDNSVKVLDAAKRYLDDLESTATAAGERTTQRNIGKVRDEILDAADAEYPRYASARLIQTIRQKYVEEPLKRSATGRLGDTEKLTQQWEVLFTKNPADVSPKQVSEAVGSIAKADPDLAVDFVNRYLQRSFRKAQKVQDTSRAGAAVERSQFGDPDVGANIEAALKALPDGNTRWAAYRRTMDIFEAQGTRMPVNSATASNQIIGEQMKNSSTIAGAGKLLANPPGTIKQAIEWWRYGRNTEQLAQALTGDIANLRQILLIGPKNERAAVLAAGLIAGQRPTEPTE